MALFKLFSRTKVVQLGEGISGTVERHDKGASSYVVKTYHCKESYESRQEYRTRILHEYGILKRIQHRNFIGVIKYEVSLDGGTIKMYMEAGTRDLYILFKNATVDKIPVHEVLCLWKQACTGIQHLHALGICHRDLKLENMVYDPHGRALKIIDLATAAACDTPAAGMVGSSRYMAPETYAQITYDGAATDVWSLGIILFYMISRQFPWKEASHANAAFVSYSSGVSPSPELQPLISKISHKGVDLLEGILCTDPKRRVSMEEVCKNAWVEEIAFCDGHVSCSSGHILGMQT